MPLNWCRNYRYFDNGFQSGINYYRLKEIDIDGQVKIHKIISVDCGNNDFSIFPNPTTSEIIISNDQLTNFSFPTEVTLFNVSGQIVLKKQLRGNENEILNLSDLPKGIYSCHFFINGRVVIKKIIVI